MKKNANNPIIFIGMGRSGSSVIYEAFSQHPELAFFSQYCTRIPFRPELTWIHRFFNYNRKKEQWKKQSWIEKLRPNPKEAYVVWEYLCGAKFRFTFLDNINATETEKKNALSYIKKLVDYQGKKRFVAKLTGPPRIQYLSSIFQKPYFIDIVRDPRAVVFSLINTQFRKKKGLRNPNWANSLNENDLLEWDKYNRSAIALASLEWRSVFKQTKRELYKTDSAYLRIKYEDFIANPGETMTQLIKFTLLPENKTIFYYIENTFYESTNYKYINSLKSQEIKIIENICEKEMVELGYK